MRSKRDTSGFLEILEEKSEVQEKVTFFFHSNVGFLGFY